MSCRNYWELQKTLTLKKECVFFSLWCYSHMNTCRFFQGKSNWMGHHWEYKLPLLQIQNHSWVVLVRSRIDLVLIYWKSHSKEQWQVKQVKPGTQAGLDLCFSSCLLPRLIQEGAMALSPAAQNGSQADPERRKRHSGKICSAPVLWTLCPWPSPASHGPIVPALLPIVPLQSEMCTQHGLVEFTVWHHLAQSASLTPCGKGIVNASSLELSAPCTQGSPPVGYNGGSRHPAGSGSRASGLALWS